VDVRHTRLAVRGVEGVAVLAGQNESRCSAGMTKFMFASVSPGPVRGVEGDCR
jgi:hypothetical protein